MAAAVASIIAAALLILNMPAVKTTLCPHEHWEQGKCVQCGKECDHKKWSNGYCRFCGIKCAHDWDEGECRNCNLVCRHGQYRDEICVICGVECGHRLWEKGICRECGAACEHRWKHGICDICAYECDHPSHDLETQACEICGEKIPHHFVKGKCNCGAEPVFYDDFLPDEYYEPCDHPGTVESFVYRQQYYQYGDYYVYKYINIYLPYGYTENRKYNVVFLIHGGGDDETSWTTQPYYLYGKKIVLKNVYDHMIEDKVCEPFIVVSPTTFMDQNHTSDSGIEHMAREIREVLLPYIAEHYSTYAEDGSLEEIGRARMHFGIGGLSNGSLYAHNSGMMMNFDLFGNFACFSGNNEPYEVAAAINSGAWSELPIGVYYAGAGTYDGQQENSYYGFHTIIDSTDRLVEGENAFYFDIVGGHDWKIWNTHIFNAMQLMFPDLE